MGNQTVGTLYDFVFFHAPAYSSGSDSLGSNSIFQWEYDQHGADAVFNGHAHHYERLKIRDIPHFIIGVSGDPTFTNCNAPITESQSLHCNHDHGAIRVTVNYTNVFYEFIHDDGVGSPPTFFQFDNYTETSNIPIINGYQIDRRVCGGAWSTIVSNSTTRITNYNDTGLSPQTCYDYRVIPLNSVGAGNMSETAQATL